MSVRASNKVRALESQKFYHGATLTGHFHFRLRSTIFVHKFWSATNSVDISPPTILIHCLCMGAYECAKYKPESYGQLLGFIACVCARMNELKMSLKAMDSYFGPFWPHQHGRYCYQTGSSSQLIYVPKV